MKNEKEPIFVSCPLSPLACPKHGQLKWKHVTTMKTCGICMEEMGVDAGRATILTRLYKSENK